jgi:hypothetical protein
MGDGAEAAGATAASRFGTICVFCGSNAGRRRVFGDAALDLGHELVRVDNGRARGAATVELSRSPPPPPPSYFSILGFTLFFSGASREILLLFLFFR